MTTIWGNDPRPLNYCDRIDLIDRMLRIRRTLRESIVPPALEYSIALLDPRRI
jgi:hypothetical protein